MSSFRFIEQTENNRLREVAKFNSVENLPKEDENEIILLDGVRYKKIVTKTIMKDAISGGHVTTDNVLYEIKIEAV